MNEQNMQIITSLFVACFVTLDSICSLCFRGILFINEGNEGFKKLASFQHKTDSSMSQHCMQLFMMLLLKLIKVKLQRNFSVDR